MVGDYKTCKTCKENLPTTEFKDKPGRKYVAHCNQCYPTYVKYQNIKRKYGLSKDEYDTLVSLGCGICGGTYRLAIDHDHSCCAGESSCGSCIRGVLCMRHNIALGQVRDSIEELRKMIGYLEK